MIPTLPIDPKVSGIGVVTKKDGTVSKPEPESIALLRKVAASLDQYWDEELIAEVNGFLANYKP